MNRQNTIRIVSGMMFLLILSGCGASKSGGSASTTGGETLPAFERISGERVNSLEIPLKEEGVFTKVDQAVTWVNRATNELGILNTKDKTIQLYDAKTLTLKATIADTVGIFEANIKNDVIVTNTGRVFIISTKGLSELVGTSLNLVSPEFSKKMDSYAYGNESLSNCFLLENGYILKEDTLNWHNLYGYGSSAALLLYNINTGEIRPGVSLDVSFNVIDVIGNNIITRKFISEPINKIYTVGSDGTITEGNQFPGYAKTQFTQKIMAVSTSLVYSYRINAGVLTTAPRFDIGTLDSASADMWVNSIIDAGVNNVAILGASGFLDPSKGAKPYRKVFVVDNNNKVLRHIEVPGESESFIGTIADTLFLEGSTDKGSKVIIQLYIGKK